MFGDFPRPASCDFQAFWGSSVPITGSSQGARAYTVPPGATMLYMIGVGPGGAGGNGFTAAAGSARGGGGGGGSGAIMRLLIPAKFLPKTIYVRPGGATVSGGPTASATTVSVYPGITGTINAKDLILIANAGSNGGNGTGSAGGTAGAAGTVSSAASAVFQHFGIPSYQAGQAGGAGGAHTGAAGTAVVWGGTTVLPISGGAGGGGTPTGNTDFAGGAITGTTVASEAPLMPTIAGGLAAAGRGNDGQCFIPDQAFRACGGSGGGTAGASGTAGRGGNASWGSGGGGGGGGVTGGSGGNGGPGFVFIVAW